MVYISASNHNKEDDNDVKLEFLMRNCLPDFFKRDFYLKHADKLNEFNAIRRSLSVR
jgi:hypothetical protein